MVQLLSALWIQVNLPDNLPANIEAIAHSFCLALISSRLKVNIQIHSLLLCCLSTPLIKIVILAIECDCGLLYV